MNLDSPVMRLFEKQVSMNQIKTLFDAVIESYANTDMRVSFIESIIPETEWTEEDKVAFDNNRIGYGPLKDGDARYMYRTQLVVNKSPLNSNWIVFHDNIERINNCGNMGMFPYEVIPKLVKRVYFGMLMLFCDQSIRMIYEVEMRKRDNSITVKDKGKVIPMVSGSDKTIN